MSEPTKAVFLSYASQDAEAARRICDSLRSGGVEVWFDADGGLEHGDEWDAKIRRQIKECVLFIPVVSANTQARHEGYFRIEWELAAQRAMGIASGVPFILPVVIDDTREPDALVPDRFRTVQWTRLRGGEVPADVLQRFLKLWSHRTGVLRQHEIEPGRPRPGERDEGVASPTDSQQVRRRVPAAAWAVAVIAVALAMAGYVWLKRPTDSAATSAQNAGVGTRPPALSSSNRPIQEKSTAPLTEAQKLVAQARQIYDGGDELDRENLSFADDLVKRALALDSAEPSAWELGSELSYTMVWHSIDPSDARKDLLMRQATRARALAPQSISAQLAVATARLAIIFSSAPLAQGRELGEIERELLALAEREPKNWRVQQALGTVYRFLDRPDDSIRAHQREVEFSGGLPMASADLINVLVRRNRFAEAEAIVGPALARRATGRLLTFDLLLKTRWRGDLAGARAALAGWPSWLLQEDRGAFYAWQTWLFSRDPQAALSVAQRLPRDYLRDYIFSGPRAVLAARAHEMAGNTEAAQADWRTVVQLADRELTASPDDTGALYWKAWALARLGDAPGAGTAGALLQQRKSTARGSYFDATSMAPLWVTIGRVDLALVELQAKRSASVESIAVTRAMLELDPAYDPVRSDPQFREMVAAAVAPAKEGEAAAKPAPDLSAGALAKVDTKSVAVLAFDNLSDDKGNEYFSDGISDELINALGKVPGLKVPARTSSFHFKGKDTPIPEIARQLGVAYVIEGSVQRAGEKVKITARLSKAADGFQVWTDSFLRDAKDVFAVEEEIAGLIAGQLSLKLGASSPAATASVNPQALEFYLQANQMMRLRDTIFTNTDHVEELLNRALALEPNFARAQALLAVVWVARGSMQTNAISRFSQRNSPERARIEAKARQAIALDPMAPAPHAALATGMWIWWDRAGAENELRIALSLNPSDAFAHQQLGTMAMDDGRMDDAIAEARLAVQLDPLSQDSIESLARKLQLAGRYAEAIATYDRALALADSEIAREHKAYALAQFGQKEAALALARSLTLEHLRFRTFAVAGTRAEAEKMFPTTETENRSYYLFMLGRTEEGLAALNPAEMPSTYLHDVLFEPWYDPVREDPRFRQFLETLGVSDAHARAQAWRKAHPPEKPEAKL